jgi:hypothetical protein
MYLAKKKRGELASLDRASDLTSVLPVHEVFLEMIDLAVPVVALLLGNGPRSRNPHR